MSGNEKIETNLSNNVSQDNDYYDDINIDPIVSISQKKLQKKKFISIGTGNDNSLTAIGNISSHRNENQNQNGTSRSNLLSSIDKTHLIVKPLLLLQNNYKAATSSFVNKYEQTGYSQNTTKEVRIHNNHKRNNSYVNHTFIMNQNINESNFGSSSKKSIRSEYQFHEEANTRPNTTNKMNIQNLTRNKSNTIDLTNNNNDKTEIRPISRKSFSLTKVQKHMRIKTSFQSRGLYNKIDMESTELDNKERVKTGIKSSRGTNIPRYEKPKQKQVLHNQTLVLENNFCSDIPNLNGQLRVIDKNQEKLNELLNNKKIKFKLKIPQRPDIATPLVKYLTFKDDVEEFIEQLHSRGKDIELASRLIYQAIQHKNPNLKFEQSKLAYLKEVKPNNYFENLLDYMYRKILLIDERNKKLSENNVINFYREEIKNITKNLEDLIKNPAFVKHFSFKKDFKNGSDAIIIPIINKIIKKGLIKITSELLKNNPKTKNNSGNSYNLREVQGSLFSIFENVVEENSSLIQGNANLSQKQMEGN